MKVSSALLLAMVFAGIGSTMAAPKQVPFKIAIEAKSGALCNTCTQLDGQAINTLLNYVLNAGVIGGCGKLCANLPKGLERDACDAVCAYAGIKTFISLLEKADLDPLYFCQELHLCPVDDNGAGSITSLTVTPAQAAASTTFEAVLDVEVTNHTGAGEFSFSVQGGDIDPSSAGSSFPELAPGAYSVKLSIDTSPSEDPNGFPVTWEPGTYTVSAAFCMGECGSDKPHSKVFGETTGNFTITA